MTPNLGAVVNSRRGTALCVNLLSYEAKASRLTVSRPFIVSLVIALALLRSSQQHLLLSL